MQHTAIRVAATCTFPVTETLSDGSAVAPVGDCRTAALSVAAALRSSHSWRHQECGEVGCDREDLASGS